MGMSSFMRNLLARFRKHLKIHMRILSIVIPMIILSCFLFLLTINNVYTETYDIERFDRAKETIRSPITIENEQETMRKTREAVESVQNIYHISEEITTEQIEYIEEIFDAIETIEQEQIELEEEEEKAKENEPVRKIRLTDQDKVRQLKQMLSTEITDQIQDEILQQLIQTSTENRKISRELLITSLTEILGKGVKQNEVDEAKKEVQQFIRMSSLKDELKNTLSMLVDFAVVENSFFDPEATSEARKEAENNVEPVIIQAGDVIVREGQTITNQIYEELKLVGLLSKERSMFPIIGLIFLILLIVAVIGYEMNQIYHKNELDRGKVISIIVITIIIVSIMKIVSLYTTQTNQLYFVVPIATGVLLLKLLINERIAIVHAILYAIIGSIIFNGKIPGSLNIEAGIYYVFSQFAAIIFLINIKDRLAIVRAGIGMTIINVFIVLSFIFLSIEKYSIMNILKLLSFSVASSLLSTILTSGLLPFFETSLGILSDIRLISLANPNHPLLKKLLIEAPGTYHHSIMVANLSETACEAIGANGLLARVGAYYHDVGKTVRPHYFIENQLSIKNPHDEIEPLESAEIILQHPYDGAEMLKRQKMPKELIDIAMQHHGTSLLKYFYYKEKEKNSLITENDFRYPGPKPKTKEAAIICICDAVEAAVRSLKEPTEQKIEEIVESIIHDRLMDGQLEDSPLTLKELKNIQETICETLKGIFHSRIQYPNSDERGH